MSYAIIGFGAVGQALAFARKNIEVAVAGRRAPEMLALEARAIGAAALAERLGFAPVHLGKLAEGGALVQARGHTWAALIFQDLVKPD
jgi:8-hydroxy-5-deazaflavin:NADPH oxidoreductase